MTDTIIKFPQPARQVCDSPALEKTNDLEKIFCQKPPENGTDIYQTINVYSVPTKLKSRHDFTNGTERNPNWGVMLSFSIIPGLSQAPMTSLMLPTSPGQFIAGDNLKAIRERIIFEIDKAIQIAELAEKDPEQYAQYEKALLRRITREAADDDGS